MAALLDPKSRTEQARRLARHVGAEDLLVFILDAEVKVLLAAPGFPQTLTHAREWRGFFRTCAEEGLWGADLLVGEGGEALAVVGIAAEDGTLAAFLGGAANRDAIARLRPLLPLLASGFRGERAAQIAQAQAELAARSAQEAQTLALSLDTARQRSEMLARENSRLLEAERAAREEAEAALRARDEFISIASHELRTPLTAILGVAQSAQRGLAKGAIPEERYARILGSVVHAATRLRTLIDDLLDVSRLRADQLQLRSEVFDMVDLVQSLADRYLEQLPADHVLDVHLPSWPVLVTGDPGRLEQVVDNLLSNAVKYSPAGGLVEITLRTEGETVQVRVKDDGIGLPDSTSETIFEPFGRAANAAARHLPGMGLGLYISRRIVELHEGRIRAHSLGEGLGTTMLVELPLTPSERLGEEGGPSGSSTEAD